MATHTCPPWCALFFDNILRRPFHQVDKMFASHLQPDMSVLDVGCGLGYFSIGLAKLLGPEGRVVSVDLQAKMLSGLAKRAAKAGVDERISTHQCQPHTLDLDDSFDLVLAFWMVHEVDDPARLFREITACLEPDGKFFYAEPKGHVSQADFDGLIDLAVESGLQMMEPWEVKFSRGAILTPWPQAA